MCLSSSFVYMLNVANIVEANAYQAAHTTPTVYPWPCDVFLFVWLSFHFILRHYFLWAPAEFCNNTLLIKSNLHKNWTNNNANSGVYCIQSYEKSNGEKDRLNIDSELKRSFFGHFKFFRILAFFKSEQ